MEKRINVALIGFGLSGRVFQAPIIASVPELNLSRVYTTNSEAGKIVRELYPGAVVSDDIGSVMKDESIQLVVVASPNTSHFTTAKEALISEKHVVVEKPFTVTSKEADNLIALAKKYDRILSVYHNRRLDSDFRTVRKVLDSGLLGQLAECEIHYDRFRCNIKENAWREECNPGSGMLYDLGPHLIDQALVLFGIPDSIYADIRKQRTGARVDDSFEVVLGYKGLKVTLKSGMLVRGNIPRYMLFGDKGSFVKYGMDVQEEALKAGYAPYMQPSWGKEPEELYGTIDTTINGLDISGKVESETGDYRDYYRNIYRAVMHKEEVLVKPMEARNVIRLLELAGESAGEGSIIRIEARDGVII